MAPNNLCLPSNLTVVVIFLCAVTASGASETEILLKVKASLVNADVSLSNWNGFGSPCNGNISLWTGVICSAEHTVWGLQLESMDLSGIIDIDALTELQNLRTISIINNRFEGPIPDIKKLSSLKTLYLSNNSFTGQIPGDAFTDMVWLKKLYLAHNQFTGPIPWSLTKLPKLVELMLNDNQFQGRIPDFSQNELQLVNVSNNQLQGPIPLGILSKMNSSLFFGNNGLCGPPLSSPCKNETSPSPSPSPESSTSTFKRPLYWLKMISLLQLIVLF